GLNLGKRLLVFRFADNAAHEDLVNRALQGDEPLLFLLAPPGLPRSSWSRRFPHGERRLRDTFPGCHGDDVRRRTLRRAVSGPLRWRCSGRLGDGCRDLWRAIGRFFCEAVRLLKAFHVLARLLVAQVAASNATFDPPDLLFDRRGLMA